MKRIKILVGMEQAQVILDAKCGDDNINSFPDGYPFLAKLSKIVSTLDGNIDAEHIEHG